MFKFLWELFVDILTGEDHNPIPKDLFRTLEVNGKVLRFKVTRCDTHVAFPNEEQHQFYIDTHLGHPRSDIEGWLLMYKDLSDEELALRYGLMRCEDSFYGYTQPFYWAAQGIINSLTGEVEPHSPETDRRLRPGSRCNTQGAMGIIASLPVEIEKLCLSAC